MTAPTRSADPIAVTWGLAGTALALLVPAARLGRRAADVLVDAGPAHLCAFALIAATIVATEGHLALHRKFVPKVHRRVIALGTEPGTGHRALAPLYAMALIGPPRAMIRAWTGVAAIVAAALLMRLVPEPWRAIVDGGVACALTYGAGSAFATLARDLHARGTSSTRGRTRRATSTTQRFGRFPG